MRAARAGRASAWTNEVATVAQHTPSFAPTNPVCPTVRLGKQPETPVLPSRFGMKTTHPICVTGASGFIGSRVVEQLLARGHRVRATVRNPDKTADVRHLTGL